MGDALEGNIAVVALIVSLVALVVTANQLLLQLFSSADGYRRCAESVIGVWHVKRRRVWKWSEFRFETQYVTPQIVLLSPQEMLDYEEEFGEIYLINSPKLDDAVCKELDQTVHIGTRPEQDRSHNRARKGRASESISKDIEMNPILPKRRKQHMRPRIRTEGDPLVSWLRLIRELHQLSYSYWPDDCTTCTMPIWDKVDSGVVRTDYEVLKEKDIHEFSNSSRTDIAVIYRQFTWDFMPPDMIRPLAEVNVGDIVVLAIRMGMQWRALDPDFGKMQADGNGFNLTALDVKGLGVVLRFIASGPHDRYPRIIPSRAADKLLCGIVPGDPDLVGKDFHMVNNNGELRLFAEYNEGVLSNMGVSGPRRDVIRKHNNPEVHNDTITLLLPFLPLESSTMTAYYFPGWYTESGIRGVHCFWEGRLALHRRLQERVQSEASSLTKTTEALADVLEKFDLLEQRHGDDWYARWSWNPSICNGHAWETKLSAINDARQIFDWTTNYFLERGFGESSNGGHTRYVHLVAAHACMADYAIGKSKAFVKNYKHGRGQHDLKEAYKIESKHGNHFVFDLYEVGRHYVNQLHDSQHGVKVYLREKDIFMNDDEAEAAWWVMQLRGITWHFSTWHPDGTVAQVLGDRLVPSSFYGNKSPVWIT